MAHDGLLTFFVFVTALAVLIQAGILYALYHTLSKLARGVTRIDAGLEQSVQPFLRSLGEIAAGAREPIGATLANVAARERRAPTSSWPKCSTGLRWRFSGPTG